MQALAKPRSRKAALAQSITELYKSFEAAHADFSARDRQYKAAPEDNFGPAWRLERSITKCSRIGRQLIQTPAASIAEIQLKLRVVSWLHAEADYETLEELDHHMPTVEETEASAVLAGVQADLFRLTQAH